MMRAAAVLLAAAPVAFARVNSADLNKDVALEALTKIGSLKSMDMEVSGHHRPYPPPPTACRARRRRGHHVAALPPFALTATRTTLVIFRT